MKSKDKICKCSHKEIDHSDISGECYVTKHIKGGHYQCTCRRFEE